MTLVLSALPGLLLAQPWVMKGYQMSALSFDSLGFRILIDDEATRYHASFDRILETECADILRRNGIQYVPQTEGVHSNRHPTIVLDLTVMPLEGGRVGVDELYYGTISFQREVTLSIADHPWKAIGSTWSMTFGGQARNRLAIVGDVEERLMDFLVDYFKLNSAKWIWKYDVPQRDMNVPR